MSTHNPTKLLTTTNDIELLPLEAKIALDNDSKQSPFRRKTLGQGLKEIYYEYCSNSSLHGVQYLGQRRPLKEICFWLCVFVLSIYYCSQTIGKIYEKWNDTPVIVSFSENSVPISDIPFPAVTICSETRRGRKVNGPGYYELLSALKMGNGLSPNLTSSEREEFLTLLHTCNHEMMDEELSRVSDSNEPPIDYIRILNEMSAELRQQMIVCSWHNAEQNCEDVFTKTYTEDGLCYTFNGFSGTDLYRENTVQYQQSLETLVGNISSTGRISRTLSWSLEQGYAKNEPLDTNPVRVTRAGNNAALIILLQVEKSSIDYGCSGASLGYKIVLHTPDDVPLLSKRFVRVSPDKEVVIAVKPIMVTTSDGIAKHPAEKRKCFMNSERHLRFFKVYSENNCEMECLTNYTLRECGCVKFSMPRSADMPVCAEDKIYCYIQAEDQMLLENFQNRHSSNDESCNCLPSCTSLEFDMEISQGNFDTQKFLESNLQIENFENSLSAFGIHFKDNEFIPSKRSELYGFTDFLANCGGVLGLFTGFSILSIVEWLYHLTLRLWSNMRSKRSLE